ncbi:MAG TPA: Gfo/Idh/MocA family oxidoreductase [Bacteroidales bacterium]|nr:Gfo/Idh/MocA family oxidoreductase [Bacteroidales bacterium]
MLKIGVVGVGHLGKIHLKILLGLKQVELVGFYDTDRSISKAVAEETGVTDFPTIESLIDSVDILDIVAPTTSHYDIALQTIRSSKHVFIEKPLAATVEEAKKLVKLAHEAKVKIQVGHVERFNPAFFAVKDYLDNPMFIENHRLALFNPRGTDVSVVMDLMIHDLDIVLHTVNSKVKRINASGVAVVSDSPDIANARIEFDNGCVANLTASRMSMKNMRKTRFFQKNAYISVDFLNKKSEIIKMKQVEKETDPLAIYINLKENGIKQIYYITPDVEENNAIEQELITFILAVENNTKPIVTIEDGYEALVVAQEIVEKIKMNCISAG